MAAARIPAEELLRSRRLPGIFEPLNTATDVAPVVDGSRLRCPNALTDWGGRPLTVTERKMISMMAQITEKPNWEAKISDAEIVKKWRSEAVSEIMSFSDTMFDFCMKELQDYELASHTKGFFPAISANAVVFKADGLVGDSILDQLKSAVKPLEDVPDAAKDWHPGSDGKVLDLVHPSLYPLVYGRTQLLSEGHVSLSDASMICGKGTHSPAPQQDELFHEREVFDALGVSGFDIKTAVYSKRFQWLPCDVKIQPGGKVKIMSYINSLPPTKHAGLYSPLESVISRVIPLWNAALTEIFKAEKPVLRPIRHAFTQGYYPPRIRVRGPKWKVQRPAEFESAEEEERYNEWIEYFDGNTRKHDPMAWHTGRLWERSGLIQPEPTQEDYNARAKLRRNTTEINLAKDFANQGLQVIVKLANIHLTPDSPSYAGGSWHIEGQLNEHICASALLYYDNENITEGHLAFREHVDTDSLTCGNKDDMGYVGYRPYDHEHMELLYGVEPHETGAVQNLGRVLTKEDRLVVFPNVLQHCVEPFQLADPTKPGHRKILALFLVDPHIRIPSTAHVPPQQREWWAEMITSLDRIGSLPPEIVDTIVRYAGDDLLTMEEVKALRLELMAERSLFTDKVNEDYDSEKFNFCEH